MNVFQRRSEIKLGMLRIGMWASSHKPFLDVKEKTVMGQWIDRLVNCLPHYFPAGNAAPTMLQTGRRGALYTVLNRLIGFAIPFTSRNRFRVLEIRPGYLKARVLIRGNRNHIGTMYAGAMYLLAEVPGGIMALFEFGSGYYPILKEMTITYLQLARTDLTVEYSISADALAAIREEADREGKSDFNLSADLIDKRGEVVARTVGHYQLRRRGI